MLFLAPINSFWVSMQWQNIIILRQVELRKKERQAKKLYWHQQLEDFSTQ